MRRVFFFNHFFFRQFICVTKTGFCCNATHKTRILFALLLILSFMFSAAAAHTEKLLQWMSQLNCCFGICCMYSVYWAVHSVVLWAELRGCWLLRCMTETLRLQCRALTGELRLHGSSCPGRHATPSHYCPPLPAGGKRQLTSTWQKCTFKSVFKFRAASLVHCCTVQCNIF